jgi:hypothetical protein
MIKSFNGAGSHRYVIATGHWQALQEQSQEDEDLRSGDDDFGVNHLLLKDTALALLVGGGDESVSLLLEPLADSELVLSGTEEAGLLFGVLLALGEELLSVGCLGGWMDSELIE